MTEGERLALTAALVLAGLGWWSGVEAWHKWGRANSVRAFWLRATAPWAAAALLGLAFWLLIHTERLLRARGR